MAIDRDNPLSRDALKRIQEEMLRNYRIRNTHQKSLAHNTQWMYAEMVNCSVGFCYLGDTAGDYFQPANASYTQDNFVTSSLDLDTVMDCMVPVKKDDSGEYVAILHAFGKNVTLRARCHSRTWAITADCGDDDTYRWAHGMTSVAVGSQQPVEWFYDAKAEQANAEDGTDRLIAAMITEWRLPTANMP